MSKEAKGKEAFHHALSCKLQPQGSTANEAEIFYLLFASLLFSPANSEEKKVALLTKAYRLFLPNKVLTFRFSG